MIAPQNERSFNDLIIKITNNVQKKDWIDSNIIESKTKREWENKESYIIYYLFYLTSRKKKFIKSLLSVESPYHILNILLAPG